LHLHRIWANCSTENTASARVLEKLGMRTKNVCIDESNGHMAR